MRYALNLRLLIISLIVVAVGGAAAFAWHQHQMPRLAESWKNRAVELESEGEFVKAVEQWNQYLAIRPDDVEARVQLAKARAKLARAMPHPGLVEQAIKTYYATIGVAPEDVRSELRKELADLLRAAGRYTEVVDQANQVLKNDPKDAEARRLRALGICGQFRTGALAVGSRSGVVVSQALREALETRPGDVELARYLANIYRSSPELLTEEERAWDEKRRNEAADAIMDRMVAANPNSSEAYLGRYRYRVRYRLPNAESDLAAALKFGPDDLSTRMTVGASAFQAGKLAQFRGKSQETVQKHFSESHGHFQHVVEHIAPKRVAGYVMLGETELAQGKTSDALATWRRGLEKAGEDSLPQVRDLRFRLAGLLLRQGEVDEVEKQLKAIGELSEQIVAQLPPDRRREGKVSLEQDESLLRARWLRAKKDYAGAIPLLQRLVKDSQREQRVQVPVWRLLGECLMATRQTQEAAKAFERLLIITPKAADARLLAAEAWKLSGRPDLAAPHYRQALQALPEASSFRRPDAWLSYATVLLAEQSRLPRYQRKWSEFEHAFAEAKKPNEAFPLKTPWQVPLLEAQYAIVCSRSAGDGEMEVDRAVTILRRSEETFGKLPEYLGVLTAYYESLGKTDDADRALASYEKVVNNPAVSCQLRSRLHGARKEMDKARTVLEKGLEKANPNQRKGIQFALSQLDLAEGKAKDAEKRLRQLHAETPNNEAVLEQLVHMAWTAEKFDEGRQWEDKLRKLKGPADSLSQYFRARRLFQENEKLSQNQLDEVEKLLATLTEARPRWSGTHLLCGLLLEKQNRIPAAINAYQEAIKLGARHLGVYRQLVHLLYRAERFDEAEAYLAKLGAEVPKEIDLSGVQIEMARRRGELALALRLAQDGVKTRPDDVYAQIWLGQMLVANGQKEEAEAALKKAVKLEPKSVVPRDVLWRYYLTVRDFDKAKEALHGLVDNVTVSDAKRALVLAVGYDRLAVFQGEPAAGADRKKALQYYRDAVKRAPKDLTAALGLAKMLSVSDPMESQTLLREFIKRAPESQEARWVLARMLVQQGGEAGWKEAEQLVSRLPDDKNLAGLGRRVQAEILMRRGGQDNLDKARNILEEAVQDPQSGQSEIHLLLAQLCEATGDVTSAKKQYLALIDPAHPDPRFLGSYIRFLLQDDELDEAGQWLKRLVETAPDELATVRLQARWLELSGQKEKIAPLLDQVAEKAMTHIEKVTSADMKQAAQAELATGLGDILMDADLPSHAETWYRRLVQIKPRSYARLAFALAKQDRFQEAIALCVDAANKDDSIRPAMALAGILTMGKPSKADFTAAEPLLAKTRKAHPTDTAFLFALAAVRIIQDRLDEAIDIYNSVLKGEPNHSMALNNLATALTELPDRRKEALTIIDQAITHRGPQPSLLDTKGMILLLEGQPKEAAALFEEATAGLQNDPRCDFHLALAYDRTGDLDKARKALRRAEEHDLGSQVLTRTEQRLLEELTQKLTHSKRTGSEPERSRGESPN
ncbi:MAG: tetratricopeptide repeat protein [Pirellulales bacterium]|nr:tetratricopeptide repeat protein [Pirellulales bacterium]